MRVFRKVSELVFVVHVVSPDSHSIVIIFDNREPTITVCSNKPLVDPHFSYAGEQVEEFKVGAVGDILG